jgi:hypothetical protein
MATAFRAPRLQKFLLKLFSVVTVGSGRTFAANVTSIAPHRGSACCIFQFRFFLFLIFVFALVTVKSTGIPHGIVL